MGGRTMPYDCPHGRTLDWGDFGEDSNDGQVGAEYCKICEASMTKMYVIVEAGTEYNDEGYDVGGGNTSVKDIAYRTKEAAEEAARGILKETLSEFKLGDFYEYYDYRDVDSYCSERDIHRFDAEWSEFIEYAEENNINWERSAPPLVKVHEIEVEIQ